MTKLSKEKIRRIKEEVRKEFPDDPMMRELHEIRAIHYEETKNLPFKEVQKRRNREIKGFLSEFGYKLVSTGHGTSRICRIENSS